MTCFSSVVVSNRQKQSVSDAFQKCSTPSICRFNLFQGNLAWVSGCTKVLNNIWIILKFLIFLQKLIRIRQMNKIFSKITWKEVWNAKNYFNKKDVSSLKKTRPWTETKSNGVTGKWQSYMTSEWRHLGWLSYQYSIR